jgi:hypothetical protein
VFFAVTASHIFDTEEMVTFIVRGTLNEVYSSAFILLRILMTDYSCNTASSGKIFSSLKLIKAYCRTKMTRERLSGLAIM